MGLQFREALSWEFDMWKTLFRCGIVGGVVVFLWMMVSWMILPLHQGAMNQFTDESEVVSTITRYAPRDGIYVTPGMDGPQQGRKNQPFIFVNVKRGIDLSKMGGSMARGVIAQIVVAMLITYLLLKTKAMKYWNRVYFVTLIGVIAAIIGIFPAWNWWHFPAHWVALEIFDILAGWFLAGLVIAKLVKT